MALAACGFQPIYGSANEQNVKAELAAIKILPIKDRIGQQLRNNLLDQINPNGQPSKVRYRLRVRLTESSQHLAVQKSEIATRANLKYAASFSLESVDKKDTKPFNGQAQVTTSYNILNSDFGTLMAERDARKRAVRELSFDITNRIAALFQRSTGN